MLCPVFTLLGVRFISFSSCLFKVNTDPNPSLIMAFRVSSLKTEELAVFIFSSTELNARLTGEKLVSVVSVKDKLLLPKKTEEAVFFAE